MKIRIGIVGYGNLGRGAESALSQQPDMELAAVFSRRRLEGVASGAKVELLENIAAYEGKIDVMILCGGSATDLPEQTPMVARHFCVVDSFDTHANIPQHLAAADAALKKSGKTGAVAVGWDPGLFSLQRLLAQAVLPQGQSYTFWGDGVSQGHSDAIRRVDGVLRGVQYTVPKKDAIERVRRGENPVLSARQKHLRVCYVVAAANADNERIRREICQMPNYFADYDTEVNFISDEEFLLNHTKMPHGGFVLHSGAAADGSKHITEFSLKLESNPAFTASVQVAYARAVFRLWREGVRGAKTVLDIPLSYLSPKTPEALYKELL